ncbi:MAG: AEC family transporter [Candidatus Acidiferrum sp.]
MNIGGLVGALLPVFFVLALGYFAGKRHTFDADQAAGLSELALGFALPASLFVGMTEIPKELLLQQGRLILALILSHDGLFLVAWLLLRRVKSLQGPASIIYALLLATSATPVFGIAVLQPLLGDTSAGTVGLVALAINLVVPAAIILLEMSNPGTRPASSALPSPRAQVLAGLKSGLQSPLLWGPVLGIAVVLAGLRIPKDIASCLEMIGSATSGVAVFTVGLTLAAHSFHLTKGVMLATLGRITVQTALLFALLRLLHVQSPFAREALVCCSFPLATIVVLLAAKYKAIEAESASALLLSTLSLVATVPIIIAISRSRDGACQISVSFFQGSIYLRQFPLNRIKGETGKEERRIEHGYETAIAAVWPSGYSARDGPAQLPGTEQRYGVHGARAEQARPVWTSAASGREPGGANRPRLRSL